MPEGVVFDGKDFRTAKIGLAYELTNTLTTTPVPLGEPYRIRTCDQLLKRQLLYR